MTGQERRGDALPPETVRALIHTALRRQKSGDRAGARALLRMLAAQQPDEPRVWLALATVAETRAEQRQALERVIAIDPQHPLARRGLKRFTASYSGRPAAPGRPAPGRTTPLQAPDRTTGLSNAGAPGRQAVGAAVSAAPPRPGEAIEPIAPLTAHQQARQLRWPLYLVIGVAIGIVLLAAALLRMSWIVPSERPAPSPSLPGAGQVLPLASTTPVPPVHTAVPSPIAVSGGSTSAPALAPNVPTPPPATATPSPQPTPRPLLAPGAIVVQPPWHASLIRPEHAVLLEGSIGALQPNGRFVLALVAVGNDSAAPAHIPPDLFTLVDGQGRRYLPIPGASTVYLDTYGRGQRGDLSMEEEIPPGGGNVSVPLIFDVPPDTRDLTLHIGDAVAGWAVGAKAGGT
jgi:hypothetical protein